MTTSKPPEDTPPGGRSQPGTGPWQCLLHSDRDHPAAFETKAVAAVLGCDTETAGTYRFRAQAHGGVAVATGTLSQCAEIAEKLIALSLHVTVTRTGSRQPDPARAATPVRLAGDVFTRVNGSITVHTDHDVVWILRSVLASDGGAAPYPDVRVDASDAEPLQALEAQIVSDALAARTTERRVEAIARVTSLLDELDENDGTVTLTEASAQLFLEWLARARISAARRDRTSGHGSMETAILDSLTSALQTRLADL